MFNVRIPMISPLDRKLLRDLGRMKGQVLAVSLVMACGLAMMIMTRSLILTLESTRADLLSAIRDGRYVRLAQARAALRGGSTRNHLPGVATVEPRVVVDVTLDLPGLSEPATGHIISLPEDGGPPQAQPAVSCATGAFRARTNGARWCWASRSPIANGLQPGDSLVAVINGRRETLKICGIGLSPEFVFEARAGETLPDHKRFSVIWMNYRALAVAYNMDGAFNDVCHRSRARRGAGAGDRGNGPHARALRRARRLHPQGSAVRPAAG